MSSECEISLINFVIVFEMFMTLSTCRLGSHLNLPNVHNVLQPLWILVTTVPNNLNWLFSKKHVIIEVGKHFLI